MSEYNGWKNYETWNVALHIGNDPTIYMAAVWANDYIEFCDIMRHDFGYTETPDKVAYNDTNLDVRALSELIEDTKADNED
jgi:hypothetical protein|tara:strand:+ start:59 stop:301 length:243 start_codon:yes stop_codon:yes gene_type:complete